MRAKARGQSDDQLEQMVAKNLNLFPGEQGQLMGAIAGGFRV